MYPRIASKIVGIDRDVLKLTRAKEYQRLFRLDGSLILADASSLPLRGSCVDLVVSNCVLEHIFNDEERFSEVGRVLKSGADFIATVPNLSEAIPAPMVAALFGPLRFLRATSLLGYDSFEEADRGEQLRRWRHVRKGYSISILKKGLMRHGLRVLRVCFFQTTACRALHNFAVCSKLDGVFQSTSS